MSTFDLKHAAEDRTYTFYSEEEKELWRWLDMLRLLFVRSYTRNLDEVETPAQLGRASSANSVSSDSARSSLSSFTRRGGNVFTRTLFGQAARRTDAHGAYATCDKNNTELGRPTISSEPHISLKTRSFRLIP